MIIHVYIYIVHVYLKIFSSQDILEARCSALSEATPHVLTFDLLRQALSVYVRLALHKGAESAGDWGGCEVVKERVREVMEWSGRVLLPLLRGDT